MNARGLGQRARLCGPRGCSGNSTCAHQWARLRIRMQLDGRGARRLYAQLNGTNATVTEVDVVEEQIAAASYGYRLTHADVAAVFLGSTRLTVVVFAFHNRQSITACYGAVQAKDDERRTLFR